MSNTSIDGGELVPEVEVSHGLWVTLRAVLRQPSAIVGLVIVGLFVISAVFAPLLEPYSTTNASCGVFDAPSAAHWFGCDDGGPLERVRTTLCPKAPAKKVREW